jgi:Stigma-specific protein, Stig1
VRADSRRARHPIRQRTSAEPRGIVCAAHSCIRRSGACFMDADRIDTLARSLARSGSRRHVLAALSRALGLVAMASVVDGAAAKNKKKKPCPPCRKRKDGTCKPKRNGTSCGDGRVCQRGRCVCPTRTTACNGACVDIISDAGNCGGCGATCPAGTTCLHGACATTNCASPSPPGGCSGASCGGSTCPGMMCGNCDRTTEGQVACVDLRPPCEEAQGCTRTADCPLGRVCVTNGCCAFLGKPNICARPV